MTVRGLLRELSGTLGQLRYPPEFRVPRPLLAPAQVSWAAGVLAGIDAEPPPGSAGTSVEALLGVVAGVWRAGRRLDRGDVLSPADVRQVRRQVQVIRQALADDGLEIQDHDGLPFDSGMSLVVLFFEEVPGLTEEVVRETVQPSVYLRGERVQMGQVIVGRPPAEPCDEPCDEPSDDPMSA